MEQGLALAGRRLRTGGVAFGRRCLVVLVVLGASLTPIASGSAAPSHDLYAWARPGKPVVGVSNVGLRFADPVARHAAPGRYRLHIAARGNLPFHLLGPGIDRQTPFRADFAPLYATWTIRLRPGRYRYAAEGLYAKELRAGGIPTRGSFNVR